ncbi:MAG: superoxide dismutase [Anaerolinea sp.]|nr:superoxide dismutase [Anaerolinea sp.]
MVFELTKLPYAFDGLEPYIDARTVEIHYTKHHATYLANCNKALEAHPHFFDKSMEWILSNLDQIPEGIRTVVKNNGGGYFNHNLYWENMDLNGAKEPAGSLLSKIDSAFGNLANLKAEIEKTGLGRLGSGYAWLSQKNDGTLIVHATLNQDCPLSDGLKPLLVVDVWEHAYYLKYQNRRAEYLSNWWNIVNWDVVQNRFNK